MLRIIGLESEGKHGSKYHLSFARTRTYYNSPV